MVRGKGKEEKRSMTIGERQDITGLKKDAEANLKFVADNPGVKRGVDTSRLQKEVAHYDKVLQEGTPVTPRGVNKDNMRKEARDLEAQMQKGMPTRDQMDHPANNPGAVHKHLKWSKENDSRVRKYKEIQRRLEPDDPTAMDIEKLRREK